MLIITTDEKEYHIVDNAYVNPIRERNHITLLICFTTDEGTKDSFTTGRFYCSSTTRMARDIWENKILPLISDNDELYLPGIESRIQNITNEYVTLLGYLGYTD